MSNLRFWYQGGLRLGQRLTLPEELSHRLKHVLRLAAGQEIWLFNGSGVEYQARLEMAAAAVATGSRRSNSGFNATLTLTRPAYLASPLKICLAQAVAKRDKMDWIIQKASELGIFSLVPLITERVEAKVTSKRDEHWQAVAIAAAEQTERDQPLMVRAPQDFKTWLAFQIQSKAVCSRIILLEPNARLSLATWLSIQEKPVNELTILVGPEGGFSESEIALAKSAGCNALKLGPRILRTETASVVASALLQAAFGDLK